MSDEPAKVPETATTAPSCPKTEPSAAPEAPVAPVVVGRPLENPLAAYVVGGTSTGPSERMYEESFQEAEKRRDAADRDKQVAKVPIEAGGGRMYSCQFTGSPDVPRAYLLLHYVNEAGAKVPPGECLADVLIEDWNNSKDLTLQIVCPRCLARGVKHAQDCQMKIRMSNRAWHFIPGAGPPIVYFDEGDGRGLVPYNSAGIVAESEVFSCYHCSWRGRIVNNRIRTER